ncbi:MAG: hypothetical protein JJE09_03650 [Bacteroidia bacterium]|nr:hypothetical protein [Bacteroidia bacterium]
MIHVKKCLFALLIGISISGCKEQVSSQSTSIKPYETDTFKTYWYAGKAELSSYSLEQSRYGELREGKAVLIFVTEDFSQKKLVKLDQPDNAGKDKVSVLKMNFTKNFVTGIYPYSMMLSVFTPVLRSQFPNSLKGTMSSQEWCGQVFNQLTLKGNKYNVSAFSYFENEGDENLTLENAILEDELWNLIRLEPENLPIGEFKMIPGLFFTRLNHTDLKVMVANGAISENISDLLYTVSIEDHERILAIRFEKSFPHKILGWEESFTERSKATRTKAVLDKTLITDYWTKNKNEFSYLRDSLNLSRKNY